MKKQLLSLLLTLALLLCAASGFGEQAPSLSANRISALQSLAGEYGAQWREGASPSTDMNAFQMWQWTDWFLSNRVRSLLGAIQDCGQLSPGAALDAGMEADQWQLRELENTLSGFEAQLEEDRLAILNGIRLLQSGTEGDAERLAAVSRIEEAESGIQQTIRTICRDYQSYLATVNGCSDRLQSTHAAYVSSVQTAAAGSLAAQAATLEGREGSGVLALSTQQLCIRVLDSKQKPLSGARVTLTNPLNKRSTPLDTNAQGEAIFWVGDLGADENEELLLNLRVGAEGYRIREVQSVRLRSGETRSVDLQADDGTPYLIMGCFSGRDILTESRAYAYSAENTANLAFTVKLNSKKGGELELRCHRGEAADVYKTAVKKFSASDSDNTVLTFEDQWLSELLPGTVVSFTIRTGAEEYTTETQLMIGKAMVEEPVLSRSMLFSLTGGLGSLSIPGNDPFVSGSRLSLNIPEELPQTLYLPSGAALYAQGYDFKAEQAGWQTRDAEDEARAIKNFELRGKADEALATAGAHRDVNTTTQSSLLDGNEAYVTPFAKLAGQYRAYDQTLELSGTAGATVAFRAEITKTFETTVASWIASENLGMGAGFGLDVASTAKMNVLDCVPTVVGNPKNGYESGKAVSFGTVLGLTSGMGVKDDVSVDLSGYGRLSSALRYTASGVTAEASADMDGEVTLRKLFLRRVEKSGAEAQVSQLDSRGADEWMNISNTGPYGSSEGLQPSKTERLNMPPLDVAADEPRYVEIGGQTYVFWIQPGTVDLAAKLNWFNLSTMKNNGSVTYLQGQEGQEPLRQNTYMDYAFAVEASGEYCAVTILSGKFAKDGSGDALIKPSEACVATVLMKRVNETEEQDPDKIGGLNMVAYKENACPSGDYPIMPQASFLKDDNTIVSAYAMAANPQRIDSLIYAYSPAGETGMKLVKRSDLTCADSAEIARCAFAGTPASMQDVAFYALNANGELSRLTASGRVVLAQGNIVSFRELAGANRLFYLERVASETGGYAHRLRSVTPDGKKTDYDIETGATHFDIVSLDDGGCLLYWTECATTDDGTGSGNVRKEKLVRCVRYDPSADTACGPFSLVELELPRGEASSDRTKIVIGFAENINSVWLKGDGTGYCTEELKIGMGSYLRHSLIRFTYEPIASAALTAAVLSDPCVSAGDAADLALSVKNTGNTPLSAFDVEIRDTQTSRMVQTLHIDLGDPAKSTSSDAGTGRTMTGETVLRRIGSMYDPLNQGTGLLMPGDTQSYQTMLQIPADWAGGSTLVAKIVGVTDASRTRGAAQVRLNGEEKKIDTDAHDLMLSAQLVKRDGGDYVHITIRNRSGNTSSTVKPVLTATCRGKTLYSHAFRESMGDDFGYSMDVPLKTLTNGQQLSELELHVSGGSAFEEFADSDNHVRLLLAAPLCVIKQPVSIPASEGKEAVFTVAAAGGSRPYRYQWQSMSAAGQWKDIPGENQETYRIASVSLGQNGLTVRCVITDQFGDSATSDPATLSILPQTGDSSQLTLWLLLALSFAAALVMARRRRCSR